LIFTITLVVLGITADFAPSYREGGFVVIRVQILSAEKFQLLRASRGEEFADKFSKLLECLEFLGEYYSTNISMKVSGLHCPFTGMEEALQKVDTTILKKVLLLLRIPVAISILRNTCLYMIMQVQENMMLRFSEMIPKRMAENGVNVNCVVSL
jgi:hypothetical protein